MYSTDEIILAGREDALITAILSDLNCKIFMQMRMLTPNEQCCVLLVFELQIRPKQIGNERIFSRHSEDVDTQWRIFLYCLPRQGIYFGINQQF